MNQKVIFILLLITSSVATGAESPTLNKELDTTPTELEVRADAVVSLYYDLVEETDKKKILVDLKKLKVSSQQLHDFLATNNGYEPDLFYLSNAINFLLERVFNSKGDIESCSSIKSYMEYSYRTPIAEQDAPTPSLWLIIKRVC